MNKIILNRVNLDGFKLNPIGKQVDKKDFEYLVVDREFKFDKTAGGKTIKDGTARIETIKGNSVVWNQLVNIPTKTIIRNGVTLDFNGETRKVTINGTAGEDISYPIADILFNANHDYYLRNDLKEASRDTYYITDQNVGDDVGGGKLYKFSAGTGLRSILIRIKSGVTFNNVVIRPRLTDLTQMFGAGNEPTTIEEFYARIPSGIDEYAYNEGEVINMKATGIKSVGVNQWDEEWRKGSYDNQGNYISTDPFVASKNPVKVLPNKEYHFSHKQGNAVFVVYWYDNNMKFISRVYLNNNATTISPNGACYMNFRMQEMYGTTYNHDICINLSDPSINGKYFPYVKREQNLDIIGKYFPNGMKSAGTAHDEIRYNKTTQKWESVKRIGSVDLGTLEWEYVENASVGKLFTGHRISAVNISNRVLHICAKYTPMRAYIIYGDLNIDKIITIEDGFQVRVKDSAYTDAASFKAAMAGVILYYELAEPIVTEIEENINLDYPVWNVGTEKATANVPSTPFKADIRYKILKNKLKLMTLNI